MARYRYVLNLQLFSQEKTEPATPKKRQEARQKGQVAKSMELPGAVIMLGGFSFLAMYGSYMGEKIVGLFAAPLREYMLWEATEQNVITIFSQIGWQLLLLMLPIMGLAVLLAVVSNYMQVGFMLTGEPLKMKLEKLNPIKGAKNIFSMKSLIEFLKSIVKLTVIGLIVFAVLWGEKTKMLTLSTMPLESLFSYIAGITLRLGLLIGGALVVIAAFDYAFQRFEFEKSIRMSKQDIKDEYKKTEGDPLIKGKIREKQRRMAMQRMMQEVPKADVVITNPTHFAVAIRYDNKIMEAPQVIAKGADYVALRIKQTAKDSGVTLMENKPLARALYAEVEIGETIPQQLFQAVAEVLAYVYKLKGKK
ncbi:flagellar biosynthesis protein FlhB [Paenibacillus thermotolerans]|uniref:flagellar biosynthesis protein FlhB n=1 Tax=Paenibacillus thermotolerans TaxID=3027807 RepID=UPI002368D14E|nr:MULTISPECIES: flagellar biosynthesis protein FlhB [unclassified Paenibacillus]